MVQKGDNIACKNKLITLDGLNKVQEIFLATMRRTNVQIGDHHSFHYLSQYIFSRTFPSGSSKYK